jgi:hypothetical protein
MADHCGLTIPFDPIARRMGGAKRYPSIGACADDGFREEINPSYKTTPTDLRAQPNLLNGIKLMLPVQSHLQKYSGSLLTQITCISHAVSSRWRGVSRSSRTRGGMRWTQGALLTKAPTRRSRVVLTPRRWRQASQKFLRGDGDNKARSPGRARRKPLKPSCRDGRVFR